MSEPIPDSICERIVRHLRAGGVGVRFPRVAFNAGDLRRSIVMSAGDWERVAKPTRVAGS